MATYYHEKRTLHKPIATLGGDIARHLQLRQHLGKSIVICESPIAMLSATRKQWMRLGRLLQRRRASTLNAEEILRYTRSIMHMQHMRFVAKVPSDDPEAHVFFVTPEEFKSLPSQCFTVFITICTPTSALEHLSQLPEQALVVEYGDLSLTLPHRPQPKPQLEQEALKHWEALCKFLTERDINVQQLAIDNPVHSQALDEALDSLLTTNHEFLRLAYSFQNALTLAQPLMLIDAEQQKVFDIILRLAHRVHSLTPDALNHFRLGSFTHTDSYFLRDRAAEISDILDHIAHIDQPYLPIEAAILET